MPRNLDGVAEETTESCDDIASKPVMEKAEAKVPRKATQTAVVETAAEKPIMTDVTEETTESCEADASTPATEKAEAEEPTPTEVVEVAAPESQSTEVTTVENTDDKAVNEGGVQAVNGGHDQGILPTG